MSDVNQTQRNFSSQGTPVGDADRGAPMTLKHHLHVDELLDAAFRELQHDTGPNGIEYQHQRTVLRAEFMRILKRSGEPADTALGHPSGELARFIVEDANATIREQAETMVAQQRRILELESSLRNATAAANLSQLTQAEADRMIVKIGRISCDREGNKLQRQRKVLRVALESRRPAAAGALSIPGEILAPEGTHEAWTKWSDRFLILATPDDMKRELGDAEKELAAWTADSPNGKGLMVDWWRHKVEALKEGIATYEARSTAAQANRSIARSSAFQQRVHPWMMACFGAEIAADTLERNHRFFEEATELVQACGICGAAPHGRHDRC